MPPKKAAATKSKPATNGHINGSSSTTATKKPTAPKSKPDTKAVTKNLVPKKATSAAGTSKTAPKSTDGRKRKADNDEDEDEPTTNGVKRQKTDSPEALPSPKAKARAPTATKTTASKKPNVVKPKVVINDVPSQLLNVYVFGTGDNGELGLGSEKVGVTVKRPRLNQHLAADKVGVVQVAVGGSHSAVLTHGNKIMTWGVNDEGALGRDVSWDAPTRDIDDEKSDDDSDTESETGINPREAMPTAIDMSAFPEGTIFAQLVAGDSMTFALTDDGLVYGWGTFRVS